MTLFLYGTGSTSNNIKLFGRWTIMGYHTIHNQIMKAV
jgi:hypothetical protein